MIDLYTEAMAALSKLKDDYICEDDRRVVAEAKKVLYQIKSKYERERGMLFHALEDKIGQRTCIVTKHGKVILGKVQEVKGSFVGFSEVEIPTRYSGGSITLSIDSIAEIREDRA